MDNTFDILLCLGLPWFVKALFYPSVPGNHWVSINSSGLSYSALSLLSTLFALYGSLVLNRFQLDWRVGVTCALVYAAFLALAALIELNVLALSLLSTLFALYGSLVLNRFQLDWRVGVTCALVYAAFLALAALIELNVLFVVNLPVCPH
ncbi:hypothetical protein NE865_06381 [Phthorimaea operculella]|nr:hypothetical protein NE865_06381 [Phthorimaea operculella]